MHRLDVGTSGLMVVAKSERAYTLLKQQFRERTVDKRYHALVQGHPDPHTGTIDAPDRPPPHPRLQVGRVAGASRGDALRPDRGVPRREPARHQAGDRPHPPDPGAHVGAPPPVRRRPDLWRRPTLAKRLGLTRQWLHAVQPGFEHPGDGTWVQYESGYPADLQHALDTIRAESE